MQSVAYDYIVVGGGTAGSIVAARLSEDGFSVLILEYGNSVSWCNPLISDPKNWTAVKKIPHLEWGYDTIPQKHMKDRIIKVSRAKVLGGCQVHNAMVYVRGGKEGFDQWAEEGCIGWDYQSVKPYFEKVEAKLNILHAEKNDFICALINSCGEFGIPYNPDYNLSDSEFGISSFQFLIDKDMQRETSYRSYIKQANHEKLKIRTDALVKRVLFDENKKCTGIELYDMVFNNDHVVSVNKDVILCAGSIGTPQLLMLSGIGPKKELNELKIRVISDLPGVGENLQDDVFVTAGFMSKQWVDPQQYGLLGTVIFWPSILCRDKRKDDHPTNIEASLASGEMIGMSLKPEQRQSYWIYPNIQKLNSRGTVKLKSNSIFDKPIIDPNYFADPKDIERAIHALEFAIKIGSGNGMKDWYNGLLTPPAKSDHKTLQKYVIETADTTDHFAGTAKMGPKTDKLAVVSFETLEVYGDSGLRIVDASIIPTTVSGNTQAATLMIGEKASDIILGVAKITK